MSNRNTYKPFYKLGATEVLAQNGTLQFAGMQPTYVQLENYDHLFDKTDKFQSPGSTKSYGTGGLDETLEKIQWYIKNYSYQVSKLAKHLHHKNPKQFAFNIWHFCKVNIKYKLDDLGKEQLRTPARAWADRFNGIDCDCFTIFCACILKECGYNSTAFIVAFNGKPSYQHIYVVFKGIVIDPVMNEFGKHPDYITKTKKMEIEGLHGTDVPYLMGLGNISPIDSITAQLMEQRNAITNDAQQRIADLIILNNGNEERNYMLRLAPYLQDISPTGNYIFKDAFIAEYLNIANNNGDVSDLLNNLTDEETDVLDEVLLILEDAYYAEEEALEGLGGKKGKARRDERKKHRKDIEEAKKKFGKNSPEHKAAKQVRKDRIKEKAKDVGRAIAKVFPLTAAARAAFLSMVKLNVGNIGGRLRLAYISKDEAIKEGYKAADWDEAKKRIVKVEKTWKNIGGNVSKLKSAALKGGKKKPKFTKDKGLNGFEDYKDLGTVIMLPIGIDPYEMLNGLGNLGEPATATIVAAAATALAAILPILSGFKPKKEGEEGVDAETEDSDKSFLEKAIDFGKKALGKGKDLIKNIKGGKGGKGNSSNATDADTEDEEEDSESDSKSSTKNVIMWALGLSAAGGLAYLAFGNKK